MKRYIRQGWPIAAVLLALASGALLVERAVGELRRSGETVSLTSIGTLATGDSLVVTFDVVVENTLTFDVNAEATISHQGTVSGSNFADVVTDDPGTGAPDDPTSTLVIDDSVPVLLQSFQAVSLDGGVEISWELTFDYPGELLGVSLQRSESRDGPWDTRTPEPLPASTSMSMQDSDVREGSTYWYRLLLAQAEGVFTTEPVSVVFEGFRTVTALLPPRVLGESVQLRYSVGEVVGSVALEIYDIAGRRVRTLEQGSKALGEHEATWDLRDASGRAVARGVYVVRLVAGRSISARKLLLAR